MTVSWRRFARPALGIGLLAVVIVTVDPGDVVSRLAVARAWIVFPAVIALAAMHAVSAAGWRAILARVGGMKLSWRSAMSVYYASQAIGGITPANLGGDVHRVASLRKSGRGWKASVAPIIIQRATSYLALSVLSLAGLLVLAARMEVAAGIMIAGLAFASCVAIAAWVLLYPPTPLRGMHTRLLTLVGGGATAGDQTRIAGLGSAVLLGLGLGVAFHAGSIGLTWLLVLAVDPAAPGPPVLAALAVARLGTAVPFLPSGLGVQEGALGLLFIGLQMPPDTAIAAMLLARLSLLLTTGVGALLLLRSGPVPRRDARVAA